MRRVPSPSRAATGRSPIDRDHSRSVSRSDAGSDLLLAGERIGGRQDSGTDRALGEHQRDQIGFGIEAGDAKGHRAGPHRGDDAGLSICSTCATTREGVDAGGG